MLLVIGGLSLELYPEFGSQQFEAERQLAEATFEERWSIGESEELTFPVSVKEYGGEVYVNDMPSYVVRRFSTEGEYLNSVGEGRGAGPGEFQTVFDYTVRNEHIFIVDVNGSRISQFTLDGEFINSFSTDVRPFRATTIGQTLFVFSMFGEQPFRAFLDNGEEKGSFGEEVGDKAPEAWIDGNIAQDGQGRIIYAPTYAGKIYSYDPEGQLLDVLPTIDDFDFISGDSVDGGFGAPTSWEVRTRDVNVVDDHLLVMVHKRTDDGVSSLLDRYTWPDGEYIDSVDLPRHFERAHPGKTHFYGITEDDGVLQAYDLQW